MSCGQNPDVSDHYSGVAYLTESKDMGLTWKKHSIIAKSEVLPYGYTGDGHKHKAGFVRKVKFIND